MDVLLDLILQLRNLEVEVAVASVAVVDLVIVEDAVVVVEAVQVVEASVASVNQEI